MAKHYTVVDHQLGVNETIHAVLRYYNDNQMTEDELYLARVYFYNENTKQVRNAGEVVKVPILPQYIKE